MLFRYIKTRGRLVMSKQIIQVDEMDIRINEDNKLEVIFTNGDLEFKCSVISGEEDRFLEVVKYKVMEIRSIKASNLQ